METGFDLAMWWSANELDVLRWLHIVAMVYWLGGEWGVFQTSYKVVNHRLPLEERQRHMETAYRIDILARTGIISLLPLGLHMGYLWGVQPVGGGWLALMWLIWAVWFGITIGSFVTRGRPVWKLFNTIEDWSRYILIPTLILSGVASLVGLGPFEAGPGQKWYASKITLFGCMLIIGVILRIVMHEWNKMFAILAAGPDAGVETKLNSSIRLARSVAYIYWVGILTIAFLGAVKPF